MKNTKKRGFTLIELLAVIVILAIIALIATPIILNMITKARKNAARSSALGYIDAIEYNNGFAAIGTEGYTEIKSGDVTEINVKLKGQKPTSGTITVDKDGKVTKAENLCINGYIVTYENNDATVGNKCDDNESSTPEQAVIYDVYSPGDTVNFDPVANDKCSSGDTCYAWRVITTNDTQSKNKITLQMDRDLLSSYWVIPPDYATLNNGSQTGCSTNKGPITALRALESSTSTWTIPTLNYEYDTSAATNNYGKLSCVSGTCKNGNGDIITTNLKARLITAEEVRALVLSAGAPSDSVAGTWDLSKSAPTDTNNPIYFISNSGCPIGYQPDKCNGSGSTQLSWLIGSGSYATLSPVSNMSDRAIVVDSRGILTHGPISGGVRLYPVIEIEKSKLS